MVWHYAIDQWRQRPNRFHDSCLWENTVRQAIAGPGFWPAINLIRMHRFRSPSTIFRFRFAAILVCLKFLAVPLTIFFLIRGSLTWEHDELVIAAALFFASVVLTIATWVVSRRTHCPLCHVAVFGSSACSKNSKARRLFGSHALHVAICTLLKGRLRCPYCGEPIALELRNSVRNRGAR